MASEHTLLARLGTSVTQPKQHGSINQQLLIKVFDSIPSNDPVLQKLQKALEAFLQAQQPLPEELSHAFFRETIRQYAAELKEGGVEGDLYRIVLDDMLKNGNAVKSAANFYSSVLSMLVSMRMHKDASRADETRLRAETAAELAEKVLLFILEKYAQTVT